jgi:hypothetical protein
MQTKLVRIDLTTIPAPTAGNPVPLEAMINSASANQSASGLKLVSSFVFGNDLLLIFQKQS